jgi:YceI-like domain
VFKTYLGVCAAVLLAACGAPKTRQTPAGAVAPPYVPPPAGVRAYHIDSAQSELRLLVHRAGPMARLGHNHVMVHRTVGGWVDAADPASAASFALRVPVADFIVDDVQSRAEEGPDFSEEIPEDARSGTRHNMLSAALLDAEHFPAITLTSVAVTQAPGKLVATLAVEVAGHESTLMVPFTLETSEGRAAASGTVVLRQSEMGLTPFSVMLGALQVQDEFTVKFKLVALKN